MCGNIFLTPSPLLSVSHLLRKNMHRVIFLPHRAILYFYDLLEIYCEFRQDTFISYFYVQHHGDIFLGSSEILVPLSKLYTEKYIYTYNITFKSKADF